MDSKSPGYLKKNGFPQYNLKKAQELVDKVKAANGGSFDVTLLTTTDSDNSQEGQLLIEQLQKAKDAEEEMTRQLRLEIETLRSPKRIETLATTRLNLVSPKQDEAIVLERVVPAELPASSIVARR
jgi:hypothetical protein